MMTETVIKHKWFWAWQDDKEEQWLELMSEHGYHLLEPGFFGRYMFKKGDPQKFIYRLDFMVHPKERDSYLQLFEDAGWEFIGQFGSWQYFRKPAGEDANPEIFTNVESKIKKYQRLLTYLIIFTPIYLLPLNIKNILDRDPNWLMNAIFIFWVVLLLFFGFSAIKLIQRINALKKSIRQ